MRIGPRAAVLLLGGIFALTAACGSVANRAASPTSLPPVVNLAGITAQGRLEPIQYVSFATNASGLVNEVAVAEGDQVRAGQIVGRIDNPGTQSLDAARTSAAVELSTAYQAVRLAQSRLDAYPLPRIFVGLTAEQAARNWLQELDAAREAFEPYKNTSRKALRFNTMFPSLPRRVWFDTGEYDGMAKEYKKRIDLAWVNYRKAVEWLALESTLEEAKARLARAEKISDRLSEGAPMEDAAGTRAALADAEIRAPFAGTITNLPLKSGETVAAGQAVFTIADLTAWTVKTTDLTEIDVVNIDVGMPVKVSLDAVPGKLFDGTVQSISQDYGERQGDIVYAVTVLLRGHDPAWRWGMTAEVRFGP